MESSENWLFNEVIHDIKRKKIEAKVEIEDCPRGNRFFWLDSQGSEDQNNNEVHGMFPDRCANDWEDVSSEETSVEMPPVVARAILIPKYTKWKVEFQTK